MRSRSSIFMRSSSLGSPVTAGSRVDALQHHRPNRHLPQDDLGNGRKRETVHSPLEVISLWFPLCSPVVKLLLSGCTMQPYIMSRSMPLTSGTKLGPYEIQSQLGAGGMGEVYRALDTRLNRTVAIKILASHLSNSPELKQRMEREARAIS